MRILVNFQHRDTWWVQCLAEDAKTSISPRVSVRDEATLLKLLRYVGGDDAAIATVENCLRQWGRGSVWIDLVAGRKNLLKIMNLPW